MNHWKCLLLVCVSLLLGLMTCKTKNKEPGLSPATQAPSAMQVQEKKPIEAKHQPQPSGPASNLTGVETEILGTLSGQVKVENYAVLLSQKPCSQKTLFPLAADDAITINLPAGSYFVEFFVPPGTIAHVCAVGLDKSKDVVALGGYAKNPIKIQGEGEVVFDHVDIALKPVKSTPLPQESKEKYHI